MLNEENKKKVEEMRLRYPTTQALLLPVLWLVQEQEGYISHEAMRYVGDLLGIPYGHILGVVTFYEMLRTKPGGKNHIEVCTNVSCMLRGSQKILAHLENRLRIKAGETTPDKKWTLSTGECMGACGNAPMIVIGDEYYENLTIEKLDKILDSIQ